MSGSDPARARALATTVLRAEPRGLPAAEAERALGMAARHDQDMAAAVHHLTRAIRLAERAGAPQVAAEVRISLALALAYQGRMRAALADLDRAGDVLTGPMLARVELQRAGGLADAGQSSTPLWPRSTPRSRCWTGPATPSRWPCCTTTAAWSGPAAACWPAPRPT